MVAFIIDIGGILLLLIAFLFQNNLASEIVHSLIRPCEVHFHIELVEHFGDCLLKVFQTIFWFEVPFTI